MARDVPGRVNIIAHLDSTAEGGIRWDMQSKFKKGGRLVFENEWKGDEFLITFDLDDKTGLNLVCPDNLDDAMWVSAGVEKGDPECPKLTACHNEVFRAVEVGPKGNPTRLTVRNKNNKPENVAFSLRYIPKNKPQNDPKNFVIFDPISENKNGGGNPPKAALSKEMTGVLIVGAVAALAYFAYRAFAQ